MKRRGRGVVALSLCVLLCLGLAVSALAAEEFVIVDGNLQEYHGSGGKVVIPDGVLWVDIGAFTWREDITQVVFPAGLISIVDCAFYGCTGLREVTVPKHVANIGSSAFANCTALERVVVEEPSNLSSIRGGAFAGCTSLEEVTIPQTATIEPGAFRDTPWQAQRDRQALRSKIVAWMAYAALAAIVAGLIWANAKRKTKE